MRTAASLFDLILEQARLRGAVSLEGGVAVQVIGRQIEQHADVGAEGIDQLELETADFDDGDAAVGGFFDSRD